MSSLLEQAIIDAKMLKEASMKRAEEIVLEQYKQEIKQQAQLMLEQDDAESGDISETDPMLSLGTPSAEVPPADKKIIEKVPAAYLGEDNLQEIEINLDSIVEKIDSLQKDLNIKTVPKFEEPIHTSAIEHGNPTRIAPDGIAESVEENVDGQNGLENLTEEPEQNIEEEEQLEEELVMDISNVDPGGISNEIELKKQVLVSQALEAQNTELQEQLETKVQELDAMEQKLQGMLTKLQETKGKLKKSVELNVQLKEGVEFLTQKISDVNLLNARLLYTNKVLGNGSMNERQKQQIAESISKSKTVEEARTIYETLQKSAQTIVERRVGPQSLTEAVSRSTSPFLPRAREINVDPVAERWQRIAGIKK